MEETQEELYKPFDFDTDQVERDYSIYDDNDTEESDNDEDDYSYDSYGEGLITPIRSDVSGLDANEKAIEAFKTFKTLGYTDHEAIGIVSNLAIESGNFSEDVISGRRKGDNGKARGLAQWHPDRWSRVSSHIQSIGADPNSFGGQLLGIDYELRNHETKALRKLKDSKNHIEATNFFNRHFERSADYSTKRLDYANKLMEKVKNQPRDFGNAQYGANFNQPNSGYSFDYFDMPKKPVLPELENYQIGQTQNLSAISPETMVVEQLDSMGSKFVNGVEKSLDFINDAQSTIAKGVSKGTSVLTNILGNKNRVELEQDLIRMKNKKKYYSDNIDGLGGTILQ